MGLAGYSASQVAGYTKSSGLLVAVTKGAPSERDAVSHSVKSIAQITSKVKLLEAVGRDFKIRVERTVAVWSSSTY